MAVDRHTFLGISFQRVSITMSLAPWIRVHCLLMIVVVGWPLFVETVQRIPIKSKILGPPLPHKPFVVAWNVASNRCEEKFGVTLNLSDFDIVYNQDKGWRGDAMVIFYADQLGYLPRISENGQAINGGIPQLGNLNDHLDKAQDDIRNFIPDPDFQGLAVIDWEQWHPLWNRMSWGSLLAYQNMSLEKVRHDHPGWTPDEVLAKAKSEYESAARAFISFTLSLARIVRPKASWGFYLYPDCYNYNKTGKKLSLECTNQTLRYNDEIQWMFDESTGLYPSVYLGDWFSNNHNAVYYVANRIMEAVRVDSRRVDDSSVPIFAYHSITYRKEYKFLNPYDLRNSIGVAAVLGASGMVIWGDYNVADSVAECQVLSDYISDVLGPYVKMTSDSAFQCSINHCSGNGRCIMTDFPTHSHLMADDTWNILKHLHSSLNGIFDDEFLEQTAGSYSVVCQCYNGWGGDDCAIPI